MATSQQSSSNEDTTPGHFMEFIERLKRKRAIIDVENHDNRSFGYAVLSALHPLRSQYEKPSSYNYMFPSYQLDNIQYPIEVSDVPAMEDRLKMQINLFTLFDDNGVQRKPLYMSKKEFCKFNFLFWNGRYYWIKDFQAFVSDLHPGYMCSKCFHRSKTTRSKIRHQLFCTGEHEAHKSICEISCFSQNTTTSSCSSTTSSMMPLAASRALPKAKFNSILNWLIATRPGPNERDETSSEEEFYNSFGDDDESGEGEYFDFD